MRGEVEDNEVRVQYEGGLSCKVEIEIVLAFVAYDRVGVAKSPTG